MACRICVTSLIGGTQNFQAPKGDILVPILERGSESCPRGRVGAYEPEGIACSSGATAPNRPPGSPEARGTESSASQGGARISQLSMRCRSTDGKSKAGFVLAREVHPRAFPRRSFIPRDASG